MTQLRQLKQSLDELTRTEEERVISVQEFMKCKNPKKVEQQTQEETGGVTDTKEYDYGEFNYNMDETEMDQQYADNVERFDPCEYGNEVMQVTN